MNDVALSSAEIMHAVKSVMGNARSTKNVNASASPRGIPGGEVYTVTADMIGKNTAVVGRVRCFVNMPSDPALNPKVRVDWTRNAFGFWYRMDFYVPPGSRELDVAGRLREIARWVNITAEGSVNLKSMNRMFRKVKKNRVLDKAAMAIASI